MGTWHAGPLFAEEIGQMDFYNLELADTNQVGGTCGRAGRGGTD